MKRFFIYRNNKYEIPNSKNLIFSLMKVNSIEELEGLSEFCDLNSLDLVNNNISEIRNLENFSNLKNLNLSGNKIKEITGLHNNKSLIKLDLSHNEIENIRNLDYLENLDVLNLSQNKIKKIENLENLKNIKKLSLSRNEISRIEKLENLVLLEKLDLSRNIGINKIENLDNFKKLKILILQNLSLKKIEGLSELKDLEILYISVPKNKGRLSEIEGLEKLENLKRIEINSYDFNHNGVASKVYVNILRFACMIKANNYKSISDWKEIFLDFPESYNKFKWANSEFKVQWFIQQCSSNLLMVLSLILDNPEFKKIRKKQEKEWNDIFSYAKEVLAPDFPKETLNEVLKKEKKLRAYKD